MKIIHIAIKDLVRSSRSFFLLGMTLAAPLLITLLIYFAFGNITSGDLTLQTIRIGILNQDVLPDDYPIEAPIGNTIRDMFFDESVQSWISAQDFLDETSARQALDQQEVGVVVIVPKTFTQDFFSNDNQEPVRVLQDPTLTIAPSVVKQMITSMLDGIAGGGIAYQTVNERMNAHGKTLEPAMIMPLIEAYANWYTAYQRALFHTPDKAVLLTKPPTTQGETQNSLQIMMGLVMAGQIIFFSFFTGAYAMNSILEEAEEGTLARLFTTPTDRTTILLGKFLAVFLTVMLQGIILLVLGALIFKVRWGNLPAVALVVIGQMFASVGFAVLLVSFIKSSKQAGPIFGGALTTLGMVSGLFTTNIDLPASFNAIGNFTPQGWVLKAWKLSLAGQPASELVQPFFVLILMGVVMFAIGAFMFRKRFA